MTGESEHYEMNDADVEAVVDGITELVHHLIHERDMPPSAIYFVIAGHATHEVMQYTRSGEENNAAEGLQRHITDMILSGRNAATLSNMISDAGKSGHVVSEAGNA